MDTLKEGQEQKQLTPLEAEIGELERRLAEKKSEAESKGKEVIPEKEMFREVVREHINSSRTTPSSQKSQAQGALSPQKQAVPQSKDDEERKEEIRALIELALTKSIQDAVKIAERESPYILDELHDHLVDDYYDKLIALRKLKAL